jgi:hypothetical protein
LTHTVSYFPPFEVLLRVKREHFFERISRTRARRFCVLARKNAPSLGAAAKMKNKLVSVAFSRELAVAGQRK